MFDIHTKVLERDVFQYFLDLEIKKAMRYQYFFSLLIIEPDLTADSGIRAEILKTMAELIKEEVRTTDVIGRMGENNFYVILPHAETSNTLSVAERIRSRIESYTFTRRNGGAKETISVGGACFPTHANELGNLVRNATKMIYEAKNNGGNKVCLPN